MLYILPGETGEELCSCGSMNVCVVRDCVKLFTLAGVNYVPVQVKRECKTCVCVRVRLTCLRENKNKHVVCDHIIKL